MTCVSMHMMLAPAQTLLNSSQDASQLLTQAAWLVPVGRQHVRVHRPARDPVRWESPAVRTRSELSHES